LRQLWVFHTAFLFSLLPFLSILPTGIKDKLVTKTAQFYTKTAQPHIENRAASAKAIAFVITSLKAGHFLRDKEITERLYYDERIALLLPCDNRGWVNLARKSCSSMKSKALFRSFRAWVLQLRLERFARGAQLWQRRIVETY